MSRIPFLALTLTLLAGCSQPEGAFPGECTDGNDNDADGVTDCDDPDCFGTDECEGGEGDTDTDSDADSDTDADADADSDTDADVDSYEGYETFDYGFGPGYGYRACSLYWDASGTPVSGCTGCEWAFDVFMSYDRGASTDDGTCAKLAANASYGYGYMEDYSGYGSFLMYQYGSDWYAWAYASFSGSNFSYYTGYEDYPYDYGGAYPGYYYTNMWAGEATVR